MRLRITATMKNQLASLRDARGNKRRGGVMRVPPILSGDEWELLAAVQQDALIAASAEDRAKPAEPVVTDGCEVARRRQAEHEAAFRAEKDQERRGALDYVREQEVRVRKMTTR